MNNELNSYELSRCFINFAFDNPEKISPNHYAIYFFAIEHCNRLGWKTKFGFPTMMACDAVGIKKPQTFIKYFNDLEDWGFIKVVERSKNQYSANIISLISATPKKGEAMDKAMVKHAASKGQSNSPINKQVNNITIEQEIDSSKLLSLYNSLLGKQAKVVNAKTKTQIKQRLKEGYTKEDIVNAIRNASKDPHHIEFNYKYLTLEFITRPDKLDRFVNMGDFKIKTQIL
jgi:uncharacterized phage protein (TIGR02220 family)